MYQPILCVSMMTVEVIVMDFRSENLAESGETYDHRSEW